MRLPPLPGEALKQHNERDVKRRVRELGSVPRLEVGQQVEPPLIECAVTRPAHRDDTVSLIAAAHRARHQVRRVARHPPAHQARPPGDLRALRIRGWAHRAP